MARIIKEEEYAARRNEILDVAQRLVYIKGYEQMSIQDILNELKISKGAFYHYFDSKQALLEALIERLIDEAQRILTPIVEDPALPAIDKLRRYFDVAARWKAAQKDYLLALLSVWYDDNNAIVRQKVFSEMTKRVGPMLAEIIRQGVREGAMATRFPDEAGAILLAIFQGLSDTIVGHLLLAGKAQDVDLPRMESLFAAYNDAVERILGTPAGSLPLVDPALVKEWFAAPSSQGNDGNDGNHGDHTKDVAVAKSNVAEVA